jgi:putative nucleotidyltransferase with HDIG domain/PAS domain S-box-containing protein
MSLREPQEPPGAVDLPSEIKEDAAMLPTAQPIREVDLEEQEDRRSDGALVSSQRAEASALTLETGAASGAASSCQATPLVSRVMQNISQSLRDLQTAMSEAVIQAEADMTSPPGVSEVDLRPYRDFFEFAPDAYLVTDAKVLIQECSRAAAAMLQMDRDSLKDKPLTHILVGKDRPAFQVSLTQLWTGGEKRDWELRLQPGEGPPFSVFANVRVQTDGHDEPVRLLWLLRDARERKGEEDTLKSLLSRLKSSLYGLVEAFAQAVEMKAPHTAGHQRRVAQLAVAIAREMDFSLNQLEGIKVAALLHDIGKIAIPAEIINKPGVISDLECELLKSHCRAGYELLQHIDFPWPVQEAILQHHERLDGSGYPAGLNDKDIILEARIIGVADVVEAMIAPRPYGPAPGIEKALEEVYQKSGILYDAEVVNICLKLFVEKGFNFT